MVQLTGSVRIQSLQEGLPNPESVFGQVYLYASAPVQQQTPPPAPVMMSEPDSTAMDTSVVSISNFTDTLSSEDAVLA